jgi:hypothetical protein
MLYYLSYADKTQTALRFVDGDTTLHIALRRCEA